MSGAYRDAETYVSTAIHLAAGSDLGPTHYMPAPDARSVVCLRLGSVRVFIEDPAAADALAEAARRAGDRLRQEDAKRESAEAPA